MPEVVNGQTYYSRDEWLDLPIVDRHAIEREMLFKHFDRFSDDTVEQFLERVDAGLIDGSSYFAASDEGCACVLGTLLGVEHEFGSAGRSHDMFLKERKIADVIVPLDPDEDDDHLDFGVSPVERLVFNVQQGDTPETDQNLALIEQWTLEYLSPAVHA